MDKYTVSSLSLQMGENELERRFVWYQPKQFKSARVQYALLSHFEKDGKFTDENSVVINGNVSEIYKNENHFSCKARASGLVAGEEYIYRVGCDDAYDENAYTFKIEADASASQSFFLIGDMHINVYRRCPERDTTYINHRWQRLISQAVRYESVRKPSFLLSVGDNISVCNLTDFAYPEKNTPAGIIEYAEAETVEFLAPLEMKEIAFATVLGNHDNVLINNEELFGYGGISHYHYDMPNDDGYSGHYLDNTSGNYYFRSGDMLVVGITALGDTEVKNTSPCAPKINRAFMERAIASFPEAKWRILLTHVPAYSYIAYDMPEQRNMREYFSDMIDGLGFDVVFTGHQHAFSRTHPMAGDEVAIHSYLSKLDENGYKVDILENPQGVIHYNIPSAHDHAFYNNAYPDEPEKLFAAYGITPDAFEGMKKRFPNEAGKFNGVLYSSPMYTYVSMSDGEMRIMTVRSDQNIPVDTLVIKK